MLGVKDAVVHSAAAEIDERDFFRRIQLGKCAYPGANEKPQVFVGFAGEIRVHKRRVFGVVYRGENIGVDVVDGFLLEEGLGKSFGNFVAFADFFLPMLKNGRRFRWSVDGSSNRRGKLRVQTAAESK